jgi:hypothetical protein
MHACLIQSNSIHKRSRGMEQLGAEEGMRGLVWFGLPCLANTASLLGESNRRSRNEVILYYVMLSFDHMLLHDSFGGVIAVK